jgi:hypothetical protein
LRRLSDLGIAPVEVECVERGDVDPQIPSTARNGMGPPAALATVTRFNASWMVSTSSGLLRASGPRPTGWLNGDRSGACDERPGKELTGARGGHHQPRPPENFAPIERKTIEHSAG